MFFQKEAKIVKEAWSEVDSMIIFAKMERWEERSVGHLKQILVEFSSPQPVFSWIKEIKDKRKFLKAIYDRLPDENN